MQTYITNTNDLFAVVNVNKMFKVYKIDLDEANVNELDSVDKDDIRQKIHDQYRIKTPIF